MENRKNITVTAHTGTMGTPMNSLEAIETGIRAGADIVEFDLNFNAEGTAVLSHNPPQGGEVLFEDALIAVGKHDGIKINIDVKNTLDLVTVEKLIEKHGLTDRAFFTGINENNINELKKQGVKLPYYLNYYHVIPLFGRKKYYRELSEIIKGHGAVGLNAYLLLINKPLTDYLRSQGLLVSGWTANKERQMRRLIRCGVDNITTRHPDVLINILKK